MCILDRATRIVLARLIPSRLKGAMAKQKEFSAEAVAITALQLAHGILRHLAERQIIDQDGIRQLFAQAVDNQQAASLPANAEAAELLADMAKAQGDKWR